MQHNVAFLPLEGPGSFAANPATKPPIVVVNDEAARGNALATFDDHLLDMMLDHERKLGIIRSVKCSLRYKNKLGVDETHKQWPGPEHTLEDARMRYATIRIINHWR